MSKKSVGDGEDLQAVESSPSEIVEDKEEIKEDKEDESPKPESPRPESPKPESPKPESPRPESRHASPLPALLQEQRSRTLTPDKTVSLNKPISQELTEPTLSGGASNIANEEKEGELTEVQIDNTSSPVNVLLDLAADEDEVFHDDELEEYQPSLIFKERGYLKLRSLFDNIITELDGARQIGVPLEEVKELFYTVWASVEKSHQHEMDLVKQDRELSTDMADKMAKTKILIKLANSDPDLAQRLGRRLEAAWSLVDIGEAEERKNTQKIEVLREEIFTLNRSIAAAANLEGLDQVNDLVKLKKRLTEERDVLVKEASKLRVSMNVLRERRAQQAERKVQFQEMIKFSLEEGVSQKEAIARETARKETILIGIEEATKSLEVREEELIQLGKKVLNGQQKIEELERNVRDQKFANEAALREAELSSNRIDKLRQDFEIQTQLVERMTLEALARSQDFKSLEDEINNIKLETHRVSRLRSANNKKAQLLDDNLTTLETERENLKGKITVLEKDLEAAQKKLEENRRRVEELDKERTFVNRNLQRAVAVLEEHESQAKVHAAAVANLQSEMQAFDREIKNQMAAIEKIDSERDWYTHEATKLTSYAALGMEEVKKISAMVFEVRKRVGEIQEEYKKAHQLYEAAMYEKLNSEKLLRELEVNILNTELKIKYKVFELNALNYQLYDKEKIYVVEMDNRERIVRQTKFFSEEKKRMLRMSIDVQRQVEALEVERSTLGCMIAEAEGEIAKQKYYCNDADSRRNNYQRKLMLKEHELKEVVEKWRTLNSQVRIGNYHYRRILKEIREIRQCLVNIRRLQFYFKNNVNHVNELRQEIAILENCISKEQCMVNDLNDQLTNAKNIHRWRKLEALDPEAYDMVRKINLVINRLVQRNAEILHQSEVMKGKEEILVEIRKLLRRSPGLETPEERLYVEHLVLAKQRQFDTLKRELNTAEGQTSYYRKEVAKLNDIHNSIRDQYFEAKRKELKSGMPWSSFVPRIEIEEEEFDAEEDLEQSEETQLDENSNQEEEAVRESSSLAVTLPIKQNSIEGIEFEGEGLELEQLPFLTTAPIFAEE